MLLGVCVRVFVVREIEMDGDEVKFVADERKWEIIVFNNKNRIDYELIFLALLSPRRRNGYDLNLIIFLNFSIFMVNCQHRVTVFNSNIYYLGWDDAGEIATIRTHLTITTSQPLLMITLAFRPQSFSLPSLARSHVNTHILARLYTAKQTLKCDVERNVRMLRKAKTVWSKPNTFACVFFGAFAHNRLRCLCLTMPHIMSACICPHFHNNPLLAPQSGGIIRALCMCFCFCVVKQFSTLQCGCLKWIIKTSAGIIFDECIKRIEKNYFYNGKSVVPNTSVPKHIQLELKTGVCVCMPTDGSK